MKRALSLAILAIMFVMCFGIANADVIYDSMPGNVYDMGQGGTISGSETFPGTIYTAQFFTVSGGDFTLDSVEIAARPIAAESSWVNLYILADNSGTPGSIIENLGTIEIFDGVYQFNSTTNPLLQDGTGYWIAGYPGADSSWSMWCQTSGPLVGTYAFNEGNGWYTFVGAIDSMRINGTPVVPEPSSILMLLGGAGALGGIIIRKRK